MRCETYRGTHRQIGRQIGEHHATWIHRTLATFVQPHAHDFTDAERRDLEAQWHADLADKAPRLLDQLIGVSEGAEAPLGDVLAMNFRFWNILAAHRGDAVAPAEEACTNIALRDPGLGVVLGGSLDDIALPWHLARFSPTNGLRHLCVTWIGSAWGGRGINEAGLAVGASSMPVDGMRYPIERRFDDLAIKVVLEQAHHVEEAVALIRSLGPYKGTLWLLADRHGTMRLVEAGSPGVAVHEPTNDVLYCVNCVRDAQLRERMEAAGYRHANSAWATNRERAIQRHLAEARHRRSRAVVEAILCDHDGFPESVCHPSAVYHTIAAPQSHPHQMWVTQGPSCRQRFEVVAL